MCTTSHLTQFAVFTEEEDELNGEENPNGKRSGTRVKRQDQSEGSQNPNNPKGIEISDLRTLVIGVSITGTIILVVGLTALLVS